MTDVPSTPPADPEDAEEDGNLLLDEMSERLTTLRVLRADDPDARGRLLFLLAWVVIPGIIYQVIK